MPLQMVSLMLSLGTCLAFVCGFCVPFGPVVCVLSDSEMA